MTHLPLLLLLAAGGTARGDEIVARVEGAEITIAAYDARLETFRRENLSPTPREVVQNLVDEVLLATDAERTGLAKDPEVAKAVEREQRRVVADAFVATAVAPPATPPEPMVRNLFHATADFARFHLLTYADREQAAAGAERLRKGTPPQQEQAKALTAHVTARDADAPLYMRAQLERTVVDALFAGAKAGEVVGPFPLSAGFAVAKVVEIIVGDEKTFQEKRNSIADHARTQLAAQAKIHFVRDLRTRSGVKLDEPFLASMKGIEPTPAEANHVIATIDGKPLRYGDISGPVQEVARAAGGHGMGPGVKTQVAWQEIDARLLFAAAQGSGYLQRPDVASRARVAARGVLASHAYERLRRAVPAPTDAEVAAFYERNKAAYHGRKLDEVRPDAVARALLENQDAAVEARLVELRKRSTMRIEEAALARAAKAGT